MTARQAKSDYFMAKVQSAQAEGLSFDAAFRSVLAAHPDLQDGSGAKGFARTPVPGFVAASVAHFEPVPVSKPKAVPTRSAAHVKATPKIGFVADGSRHPFAAQARARGLTLVEGGQAGWFIPLPGTDE